MLTANQKVVRLLVVEPDLVAQRPIRAACSTDPDIRIVGYVRGVPGAASLARAARPDIVVYDPDRSAVPDAVDTVLRLRAAASGAPIVLFSEHHSDLLAACANASVPKHHPELLGRIARSLAERPRRPAARRGRRPSAD